MGFFRNSRQNADFPLLFSGISCKLLLFIRFEKFYNKQEAHRSC